MYFSVRSCIITAWLRQIIWTLAIWRNIFFVWFRCNGFNNWILVVHLSNMFAHILINAQLKYGQFDFFFLLYEEILKYYLMVKCPKAKYIYARVLRWVALLLLVIYLFLCFILFYFPLHFVKKITCTMLALLFNSKIILLVLLF